MEYTLGKQAVDVGASKFKESLSKLNFEKIRKYLDVTNSYVLEKILLIVFPFYYKDITFGESLYRPDLYIPVMSLITLNVFKAFLLGLSKQFHPERLVMFFSRALIIHIILGFIDKGIAYFADISVDYLDLLCFIGYKYVSIFLIKVCKLFYLGKFLSLYFYIAFFFFLSRSLKSAFITPSSPKQHLYALFLMVGLEIISIFFFSL